MNKKIFFVVLLAFGFVNGQVLLNDTFNTYTIGNVGTSYTGASPGQGGWYTSATSTDTTVNNDMFQIGTRIASTDKVMRITGSADIYGTRYAYKSIASMWATRTHGNNILQIEFDIYTGAATFSKNVTQVFIYDLLMEKVLAGASLFQENKSLQGVAYSNGTALGNNNYYLGGSNSTPFNLIYSANEWYRVGVAFDKTTGNCHWKILNNNRVITGSAAGIDPDGFYMQVYSGGTGNNMASVNMYDNIVVTAVNAVNLLSVNETKLEDDKGFEIYPNPASDFVSIDSKDKIIAIYVYDYTGKRIELKLESNNKVNVSSLVTGNYLLGIKTEKEFLTQKLIKK